MWWKVNQTPQFDYEADGAVHDENLQKEYTAKEFLERAAQDWIDDADLQQYTKMLNAKVDQIEAISWEERSEIMQRVLAGKRGLLKSIVLAEMFKNYDKTKWILEEGWGGLQYDEEKVFWDKQAIGGSKLALLEKLWLSKEEIITSFNEAGSNAEVMANREGNRENALQAYSKHKKKQEAMAVWAWEFEWVTAVWWRPSMDYSLRTAQARRKAERDGTLPKDLENKRKIQDAKDQASEFASVSVPQINRVAKNTQTVLPEWVQTTDTQPATIQSEPTDSIPVASTDQVKQSAWDVLSPKIKKPEWMSEEVFEALRRTKWVTNGPKRRIQLTNEHGRTSFFTANQSNSELMNTLGTWDPALSDLTWTLEAATSITQWIKSAQARPAKK